MKYIISTLLLSLTSQALADCKPVTYLEKNSSVPCDGYLFTPEKEKEVRSKVINYENLLLESNMYLKQRDLYKEALDNTEKALEKEEEKSKLWQEAAEKKSEKLQEVNDRQQLRDGVVFGLGILTTILTIFAVNSAQR